MRSAILSLFALTACGGSSGPAKPVPDLPADYAATYKEVRPCRPSAEHDLDNVTVLADPNAYGPYTNRTDPFPTGAVVVKVEYDYEDPTCSGNIIQWTVMEKLADGTSPSTLDWRWQRIFSDHTVQTVNDQNCINCHTPCTNVNGGGSDQGYEHTCSAP